MNRKVITSRRQTGAPPRVLANLDLADEKQRRLHDLVQRFHGRRWPLLRALGMRQSADELVEAVQWLRTARPCFAVVYWHRDGLGLSWVECPTTAKALATLRSAPSA